MREAPGSLEAGGAGAACFFCREQGVNISGLRASVASQLCPCSMKRPTDTLWCGAQRSVQETALTEERTGHTWPGDCSVPPAPPLL